MVLDYFSADVLFYLYIIMRPAESPGFYGGSSVTDGGIFHVQFWKFNQIYFQDLVKSHLMTAVRSEVEELREKISKLEVRLYTRLWFGPGTFLTTPLTTEKILQTINSWQWGELIVVPCQKCSGAKSQSSVYIYLFIIY